MNQRKRAKWLAVSLVIVCLILVGGPSTVTQGLAQRYPLGDIPLDPEVYQANLKYLPESVVEALPADYDARDYGIVTPAKDQGNCGSCWAFASVGGMESHMLIAGAGPEDLSEQQQVSCNTTQAGCQGGSSTAIRYWEAKGPLYEACFPYTASDSEPCIEASCVQLGYRVVNWHTVPTTTDGFKSSLYEYGPSYWRFDVRQDFYDYWNYGDPGDVYVNAGTSLLGGHAVLLIGWDDAKGAFLLKNSWGEHDGPEGDGTFWVAYSGHTYNLNFGMANFSLVSLACDHDYVCDEGESCSGCPSDCISGTMGSCDACFKGVCDGSCHPVKEGSDCSDCAASYCCGDGTCEGAENSVNCAIDCGAPPVCGNTICDPGEDKCNCPADCGVAPASEFQMCTDGLDNDCDLKVDCADPDCASDDACACLARLEPCSADGECCSGKCRGGLCR